MYRFVLFLFLALFGAHNIPYLLKRRLVRLFVLLYPTFGVSSPSCFDGERANQQGLGMI